MKVAFLTPLVVEKLAGREWRLFRQFAVDVDDVTIIVPRGFITDFASVPRVPLAYMLAAGVGERAATLHDWLYAEKYDRLFADCAFRAALKAEGEPGWRAALMYAGVRVGGGSRWEDRGEAEVTPESMGPKGLGF